MKNIIVFMVFMFSVTVFSQKQSFEKPNYKKIEKSIKKKKSNLFYKKLMERFQKSDTAMSIEEKRHLYYGFSFQKKYNPYNFSDYTDSMRVVLQKDNFSKLDFNNIIRFGDSLLVQNPFDLRVMNYQLYALEKSKQEVLFNKKLNQSNIILDVLFSSGDGLSKETAFYVIFTSNEYSLLNVIGVKFEGQSLVEHYDYMRIGENGAKVEGLYFDITPCLNSMSKMFKE